MLSTWIGPPLAGKPPGNPEKIVIAVVSRMTQLPDSHSRKVGVTVAVSGVQKFAIGPRDDTLAFGAVFVRAADAFRQVLIRWHGVNCPEILSDPRRAVTSRTAKNLIGDKAQ